MSRSHWIKLMLIAVPLVAISSAATWTALSADPEARPTAGLHRQYLANH